MPLLITHHSSLLLYFSRCFSDSVLKYSSICSSYLGTNCSADDCIICCRKRAGNSPQMSLIRSESLPGSAFFTSALPTRCELSRAGLGLDFEPAELFCGC